MQFSQTPNSFIKEESWWQRYTSQSHQLFFSMAIVFSIFIMFLSFLILKGQLSLEFSLIHGFGLNYAVFTNAFLGFLITVIPKYNAHPEIKKSEYLMPWVLFEVSILLTLFLNAFIGKILVAFSMFYFSYIFYKIIRNSKAHDKKDSILINMIFLFGALLLIFEALFNVNLSYIVFYSYLLAMVFIVALRMVPMFYFNVTGIKPWIKPKYTRESVVALLFILGVSVQFDLVVVSILSSFIAFIFFTYIVLKLNIYKKTPAIMRILSFAFIHIPLGFFVLFTESLFELETLKLSFHIFALGFITTMLIGFGSRVTLGHAIPAQPIHADNITVALFVFTQIVVLLRILSSLSFIASSNFSMNLLYISSFAWVVLFVLWTLKYGKILLRL